MAAEEFLRSGLQLEVDNSELSLYVSICYEQDDLEAQGLRDVTQTRVSRQGRKPRITTPEITARSANVEPKFVAPVQHPTEEESRLITSLALSVGAAV